MLQSIGQATEAVTEKELKSFCSNSPFLHVARCRSLTEEYGLNTISKDESISWIDILENRTLLYLILWDVKRFIKTGQSTSGIWLSEWRKYRKVFSHWLPLVIEVVCYGKRWLCLQILLIGGCWPVHNCWILWKSCCPRV